MKKIKVKIKDSYQIIDEALESAIERAMNRCDKYCASPLQSSQRDVLRQYFNESFWLALDDAGIEIG